MAFTKVKSSGPGNTKYIGNVDFVQKNVPQPRYSRTGGITVEVEYHGASYKALGFISAAIIGQQCQYEDAIGQIVTVGNCYLTSISSDDKHPYTTVTLVYGGYSSDNGKGLPDNEKVERTVSRSVTMTGQFDPGEVWTNGRTITAVTSTIEYETQEASITTYSGGEPGYSGGTAPSGKPIHVISVTTTVTYQDGDGTDKTMTTSENLPAGVIAKITPQIQNQTRGFTKEHVPGTQWWKATYSQSTEYVAP